MARKRKHVRKTDLPLGWHLPMIAPIGAFARAISQSPERRIEIARAAALVRWSGVTAEERRAFMVMVRSAIRVGVSCAG